MQQRPGDPEQSDLGRRPEPPAPVMPDSVDAGGGPEGSTFAFVRTGSGFPRRAISGERPQARPAAIRQPCARKRTPLRPSDRSRIRAAGDDVAPPAALDPAARERGLAPRPSGGTVRAAPGARRRPQRARGSTTPRRTARTSPSSTTAQSSSVRGTLASRHTFCSLGPVRTSTAGPAIAAAGSRRLRCRL